jgi:hypothetical protein
LKQGDIKSGTTGYFYRAKSPKNGEKGTREEAKVENSDTKKQGEGNKMANLLSCLKADKNEDGYKKFIGEADEEDEDVQDMVGRRMSMNKFNETGLNFQKY